MLLKPLRRFLKFKKKAEDTFDGPILILIKIELCQEKQEKLLVTKPI
jgi:hypothetical protein